MFELLASVSGGGDCTQTSFPSLYIVDVLSALVQHGLVSWVQEARLGCHFSCYRVEQECRDVEPILYGSTSEKLLHLWHEYIPRDTRYIHFEDITRLHTGKEGTRTNRGYIVMSEAMSGLSFPVGFAQASEEFSFGHRTSRVTAACSLFSDRIVLLLTSNGKIGQLLNINTGPANLQQNELYAPSDMSMLPNISLTPDWLLGANETPRSEMTGLLSVQATSALMHQGLGANRKLLFGFNLPGDEEYWQYDDDEGANHGRQTTFVGLVALVVRAYTLANS